MSGKYCVSVLGGGSFGTAIANIIACNGHDTYLWMRDREKAAKCQELRQNSYYLPGYTLTDSLVFTDDLVSCVSKSDIVVLAIPSKSFRSVTQKIAPHLKPGTIVISTTKGIEEEGFCLMSQILEQELSDVKIGVLSGPTFAKEIVQNQYTGSVCASEHQDVINIVSATFCSGTFRIYSSSDRYGVELGGALKNIYAIITGMASALGCGHNTSAMLLTRSLAEMERLASKLGAESLTFLGLAGVGDLILTCTSDLSRNYRVGYAVGKGKSLDEAVKEIGQVAEGVNTLMIVKQKADELGVYMPLVQGLYAILWESKDILTVVQSLMSAEPNSDVDIKGVV